MERTGSSENNAATKHLGESKLPESSVSKSPQTNQNVSIMRKLRDGNTRWNWPPEVGTVINGRLKLDKEIVKRGEIPLDFVRNISEKNALIQEYKASNKYPYEFKEPFIVKTIRADTPAKGRDQAAHEVQILSELDHEHVIAFLGCFEHQARLNIMIYPVARCDLEQFMECMSKDISQEPYSYEQLKSFLKLPDSNPSSEEPSPAAAHSPPSQQQNQQHDIEHGKHRESYHWPLFLSLQEKKRYLQRSFVCLSQALAYLHKCGIRHKDVKPGNILIDNSGSFLLTDFDISRRFAKDETHVTINEPKYTGRYAAPEMMKNEKRDDGSDVYSLGCVFLEAASLILDYSRSKLADHCFGGHREAEQGKSFSSNLEDVDAWVEVMKLKNKTYPTGLKPVLRPNNSAPGSREAVVDVLDTIKRMMAKELRDRPESNEMWSLFRSVSADICRDCDPRHGQRRPVRNHPMGVEEQIKRLSTQSSQRSPSLSPNRSLGSLRRPGSYVEQTSRQRRISPARPPSWTPASIETTLDMHQATQNADRGHPSGQEHPSKNLGHAIFEQHEESGRSTRTTGINLAQSRFLDEKSAKTTIWRKIGGSRGKKKADGPSPLTVLSPHSQVLVYDVDTGAVDPAPWSLIKRMYKKSSLQYRP